MADLQDTLAIAASGMKAQSGRMRVVAENIANADSTALDSKGNPYRRRIPTFRATLDREMNAQVVQLGRVRLDPSEFRVRFEPGHPAADANGYVKAPNVNSLIEMSDMQQATRSYQANLNVIGLSKGMIQQTIEILKA